MKKQIKRSMFIIPLALTMIIPNTLSIAAEEPQTQEQIVDQGQKDVTETKEENNQYLATFYDEDGTLLDSISKESSDSSIIINPTKIPTKEGYTFIGWTKTQGSSTIDFNKEEVTLDQTNPEVKFYAVYQENPKEEEKEDSKEDSKEAEQEMKSYTVHFLDENGNELEAVTKESEDSSIVITSTITPSKENYTFIGWASEQHSSKADLGKDGITVDTSNPELSVYAVYSLNFKATVRFCDEDGKEIETKTVMRDDIHTDKVTTRKVRPSQTPSKEGYEFLGWSTTKGSNTAEFDQGYVEVSQDNPKVTVYAVYKDQSFKFKVHFCDEDGTEIETVSKKENEKVIRFFQSSTMMHMDPAKTNIQGVGYEIIQAKTIPTKEDQELVGWSKEKGSKTVDYTNKEGVKVFRDNPEVTVYAVYKHKALEFKVHFCDEDGTEIETVSQKESDGANFFYEHKEIKLGTKTIPLNAEYCNSKGVGYDIIKTNKTPSKEKATFIGWSKEKGSKTADYTNEDGVKVFRDNPDVTVYAVYQNKYILTLCDSDGTVLNTEIFDKKEDTNNIQVSIQSKENYDLVGWTETKGGTKVTQDLKQIKFDKDQYELTLYAVYQPKTVHCDIYFRDEHNDSTRLDPSFLNISRDVTFNGKEYLVKIPESGLRGNDSYCGRRFISGLGQVRFAGWTTNKNATTVGGWDYFWHGFTGGKVTVPKVEYYPGDEIEINSDTQITLYAVWLPVDVESNGNIAPKQETVRGKAAKKRKVMVKTAFTVIKVICFIVSICL